MALVISAAVLWSIGGVFIKKLTGDYGMAPPVLACLRSAAAGLALIWALPRIGRSARNWRVPVSGIFYGATLGCFVAATAGTRSANAIFLQYAFPLLVAIGGWLFYRERVTRRTALALAIGMGGVAVILIGSWRPQDRAGLIYGVGSAFALAGFVLLQRRIREGSPLGLTSLYNLIAAAAILPFAWGRFDVPPEALGLVVMMGVVQIGLPYVLFIKGLRVLPAAEAGLVCLIEPVLNPLWVWLIVHEEPGGWTMLGAGLILVALAARYAGAGHRPVPAPD